MPNIVPDEALRVAVAVVRNAEGKILIAQRHVHVHQGGLWEFPGGKIEAGENVQAALVRELLEEVGIAIETERPLLEICHDYGDKNVHLDVWLCTYMGLLDKSQGLEGQAIRWVDPDQLSAYTFPAANQAILKALTLPACYLISPEPCLEEEETFLAAVSQSLRQGIRLVQLRANNLSDAAYIHLAEQMLSLCQACKGRLLIKGLHRLELIKGVHGVHLTAAELRQFAKSGHNLRLGLAKENLLAASCHSLEEIELAGELGVDFITLSPVLTTASHPQTDSLGWEQFQTWAQQAKMPVYALGGLGHDHLPRAWQAGAQGIAAIRSLWPQALT